MVRKGYCIELEVCSYDEILHLQEILNRGRQLGAIPDTLLLLEHQPCFTIGRKKGSSNHLLVNQKVLDEQHIKVFESNRGGDITYHGPGQLICYPIIALTGAQKDVHAYANKMEELLIRALASFGIAATRKKEYPGVWVEDQKIGAIGIAIRKWVTMHGISLNVCPNMTHFSFIVPCGITSLGVTSMSQILETVDPKAVRSQLRKQFEELFEIQTELVSVERIKEMVYSYAETSMVSCSGTQSR
jgi:lipoyl(octanoyl) transferase